MKYLQYLAQLDQSTHCPFCSPSPSSLIDETPLSYVLLARSPYVEDHVLLIPKRHVIFSSELTLKEKSDLFLLLEKWNTLLLSQHQGTSLLLRDSVANGTSGKSIGHLHIHIIPDCQVSALNWKSREFYSPAQYLQLVQNMKHRFLNPSHVIENT